MAKQNKNTKHPHNGKPINETPLVTISTQTEENNTYGKGRDSIQQDLHPQKFPLSNDTEKMPDYRKHLSKVFGEEFLAEATKPNRSLTLIIKIVREKDMDSLKKTNKYFHSLRKDLAVTNQGACFTTIN